MARKKKQAAPPPGAPAWMNTYGDMVTLVLTFFVLLFSMSTIDAKQFQMLVAAFNSGVGLLNPGTYMSDAMVESNSDNLDVATEDIEQYIESMEEAENLPAIDYESLANFKALADKLEQHIESNDLGTLVDMTSSADEIKLTFGAGALFQSGKADIIPDMLPVLDEMAALLNSFAGEIQKIRFSGHTDNLPIRNAQFEDNLDLSLRRAAAVSRYFVAQGVDRSIIVAEGYGEYQPVASNDTEEGRALNRRVELIISRVPSSVTPENPEE